MEMYYLEDYSLGEISDITKVSRQAVYDNLKRTETMLVSYEKKLNLYEKFQQRMAILDKLEKAVYETKSNKLIKMIHALKELD